MKSTPIVTERNEAFFRNKQRGASLENFIFWLIAAALILVIIV